MIGNIKALTIINTVTLLKAQFGEGPFNQFIERLPSDLQVFGKRRILAVEWVDLDLWMRFQTQLLEQLFGGIPEAYAHFMHRRIEADFGQSYKSLIRFGAPSFVVERAPKVWSTYFDTGRVRIVQKPARATPETPLIVRIEDFASFPVAAAIFQGAIEKLLLMSGAKAPMVTLASQETSMGRLNLEYRIVYD